MRDTGDMEGGEDRERVDRILSRAKKIRDLASAEREAGNEKAAENMAVMMRDLLARHRIDASALERDDVEIVQHRVTWEKWGFSSRNRRNIWVEALGEVIASAYGCRLLCATGTNLVWFAGYHQNAMLAEWALVVIRRSGEALAEKAYESFRNGRTNQFIRHSKKEFKRDFLYGFTVKLRVRFKERVASPDGQSGLMVLNQDLMEVNRRLEKEEIGTSVPTKEPENRSFSATFAGIDAARNIDLDAKAIDSKSNTQTAMLGQGEGRS